MSETAAAEAATAPAQEPTSTPANDQPTTPKADVDWVAEARKWEARAKENAAKIKALEPAAARLAEIEEAQKTEAQKLADRLAEAERKAQAAELKALRSDIAQAKGVPAVLLTGSTEEELNASADALLVFRGGAPRTPAAPPADGQGKVGESVGSRGQVTEAELASMTTEQINTARREGRLNDILRRR